MSDYTRLPIRTSVEFRNALLESYPALQGESRSAREYRKLAEYALFGHYMKEKKKRNKRILLLRHETMGQWYGYGKTRFNSGDIIEGFSAEVFPLNATKPHSNGVSRTISPSIPDELRSQRDALLPTELRLLNYNRVDLASGEAWTRRGYQAVIEQYDSDLRSIADACASRTIHGDMLTWLNNQPSDCLWKALKRNWPDLRDGYQAMPYGSVKEQIRKDATFRILLQLQDHHRIYYKPGKNTRRLSSVGTTIHQLPREMRKLALQGSIELDLQAAQLAIVSRLWGIADMECLLGDGTSSIWDKMCADLGLPIAYKPALKSVIYGMSFGMSQNSIKHSLFCDLKDFIGEERAQLVGKEFLRLPVARLLLDAREIRLDRMRFEGGVQDAFGQWVPIVFEASDDKRTMSTRRNEAMRSLLAQEAQSWEMRLMAATLPVLIAEKDIRVLSFLYDGMAIQITDNREKERKLNRLTKAVNDEAARHGFPTRLVIN